MLRGIDAFVAAMAVLTCKAVFEEVGLLNRLGLAPSSL